MMSMTLQPVGHRKIIVGRAQMWVMVWHGGLLLEEGGGHLTASSCVAVNHSEDVLRPLSVYCTGGCQRDVGVVISTVVPVGKSSSPLTLSLFRLTLEFTLKLVKSLVRLTILVLEKLSPSLVGSTEVLFPLLFGFTVELLPILFGVLILLPA